MHLSDEIAVEAVWTRAEHQRRRAWRIFAALLVFGPMALGACFALFIYNFLQLGLPWLVVTGIVFAATIRPAPRRLLSQAFRISDGVLCAGDRAIDLNDIDAGWRTRDGFAVRTRRGELIEIDGLTGEDATKLLEDMGLGPSQRTADFPLASWASTRKPTPAAWGIIGTVLLSPFSFMALAWCGAVLTELLTGSSGWSVAAGALAYASVPLLIQYLLWRRHRQRRITVGADAVAIDKLLGRRLVPMSRIERAQGKHPDCGLLLTNGERIALPGVEGSQALAQRISDARALLDAQHARVDVSELERGDRGVDAWRRDMGKRASAAQSYRDAAWGADDLADVAVSPGCSPEQRVAAALGVAASGNERALSRVRIAAEACVDADLREALEDAAEGELSSRHMKRATQRHRPI